MIERILAKNIKSKLKKGKAIIIIGARQTGKTTLLNHYLPQKKFFGSMPMSKM